MTRSAQVVRAELGCLHCGYDVGEVEGRRGARTKDLRFLPMHRGDRLTVDERGRFRCTRCGGQVLLNGVWPVDRPLTTVTIHEAVDPRRSDDHQRRHGKHQRQSTGRRRRPHP